MDYHERQYYYHTSRAMEFYQAARELEAGGAPGEELFRRYPTACAELMDDIARTHQDTDAGREAEKVAKEIREKYLPEQRVSNEC